MVGAIILTMDDEVCCIKKKEEEKIDKNRFSSISIN